MTSNKKEPSKNQELGKLRARVDGQVASTHTLIEALQQDLARYRAENSSLQRQCNHLGRTEASLDVARLSLAELASKYQVSASDNDRLEEDVRTLNQDLETLASRCDELESSVDRERESRAMAVQEIRTLQDQVKQLEGMVALFERQQEPD